MDSRNYEELISGSRQHWQQLDVDGTGFGVGLTNNYTVVCQTLFTKNIDNCVDFISCTQTCTHCLLKVTRTFLVFTLPSLHLHLPTHTFHPIP